jgi:hypothetical protein
METLINFFEGPIAAGISLFCCGMLFWVYIEMKKPLFAALWLGVGIINLFELGSVF